MEGNTFSSERSSTSLEATMGLYKIHSSIDKRLRVKLQLLKVIFKTLSLQADWVVNMIKIANNIKALKSIILRGALNELNKFLKKLESKPLDLEANPYLKEDNLKMLNLMDQNQFLLTHKTSISKAIILSKEMSAKIKNCVKRLTNPREGKSNQSPSSKTSSKSWWISKFNKRRCWWIYKSIISKDRIQIATLMHPLSESILNS